MVYAIFDKTEGNYFTIGHFHGWSTSETMAVEFMKALRKTDADRRIEDKMFQHLIIHPFDSPDTIEDLFSLGSDLAKACQQAVSGPISGYEITIVKSKDKTKSGMCLRRHQDNLQNTVMITNPSGKIEKICGNTISMIKYIKIKSLILSIICGNYFRSDYNVIAIKAIAELHLDEIDMIKFILSDKEFSDSYGIYPI